MNTFLDRLIAKINSEHKDDYRKVCIIFPTRRACLIFRNKFAATQTKPVWAPTVLSIGDFISSYSGHPVSEEIPLLATLFEVYRKYWPSHDFGKYYQWGRMLLSDFDEADKQVEDPSSMFMNIAELKKIDAAFLPDPGTFHWLEEFIKTFDSEHLTKLQKEFAENWNNLRKIYEEFQVKLDSKGLSYEGRSYRKLLKSIQQGSFAPKHEHLLFCGFFGLSFAEEKIIQELRKKIKTEVIWDEDRYYVSNEMHEAGSYFRDSVLYQETKGTIADHFRTEKKVITVTSVPLVAGQAKFAGELVKSMLESDQLDINRTAIILPDEQMLLPMLQAIPKDVQKLNVTMGFPLKNSHFSSLITVLKQLHEHIIVEDQQPARFNRRFTEQVIRHPLIMTGFEIKNPRPESIRSWKLTQREIETEFGCSSPHLIFEQIITPEILFERIIEILRYLASGQIERPQYECDILLYMAGQLSLLQEQLKELLSELSVKTAWQMIRDCINAIRIPFTGEPVEGLQIMGFLETRGLDFEHVIILNVNEGVLPANGQQHSFIPFALRKAFGLSTYTERESSYSYHFLRLLHQSSNIQLIHNSEQGKMGGGEPSRYLIQLEKELAPYAGDKLELRYQAVSSPMVTPETHPISVTKNDRIIAFLTKYKTYYTGNDQRSFSTSAVSMYLTCPMQFYLRYVAGIKEDREELESIDAAKFGSILHKVMELLYVDYKCEITDQIINSRIAELDSCVEKAFDLEHKSGMHNLRGTDLLTVEVIKVMVRKILEADRKQLPFKILQTEGNFNSTLNIANGSVRLTGYFDRVDEKDGITRIVDYKTGKVELGAKTIPDLFKNDEKKTLFQLHFYKLMYADLHPGTETVAGFYSVKNMKEGFLVPKEKITDAVLEEFKSILSETISEIFNQEIPFSQTEDVRKCKFCSYKDICKR